MLPFALPLSFSGRRKFLVQGLKGIGATYLGAQALASTICVPVARGIEPLRRVGKPSLRTGLAAYSLRKYLDLKGKNPPTMDLFGFATKAAEWGFEGVEPTSYYFKDSSPEYLARFKAHCSKLGLEITGSAVGNDFCVKDGKAFEAQIELAVSWAQKTAAMGGRTLRIFAGRTPKGDTEAAAVSRAIEGIKTACQRAEPFGVLMALENHGGITSTADQLLHLVKSVDHPLFAVNLDTGNFRTDDPYGDLEKLVPYAAVVQVKVDMHPKGRPQEPVDYNRILDMLAKAGYRGSLILEYEGAEEPMTAIPMEGAKLAEMIRAKGL